MSDFTQKEAFFEDMYSWPTVDVKVEEPTRAERIDLGLDGNQSVDGLVFTKGGDLVLDDLTVSPAAEVQARVGNVLFGNDQ